MTVSFFFGRSRVVTGSMERKFRVHAAIPAAVSFCLSFFGNIFEIEAVAGRANICAHAAAKTSFGDALPVYLVKQFVLLGIDLEQTVLGIIFLLL